LLRSATFWIGGIGLVLLSSLGCNRTPAIAKVKGVVQFDNGSPVKTGTIETICSQHPEFQARGRIERDGSFELTTLFEGDGAVVGEHQCVVVQFVMSEDIKDHKGSTQGIVDRMYADYASSGLTLSVPREGLGNAKLIVKGLKKKAGEKYHNEHKDLEASNP
jgi:hypothetical protein